MSCWMFVVKLLTVFRVITYRFVNRFGGERLSEKWYVKLWKNATRFVRWMTESKIS